MAILEQMKKDLDTKAAAYARAYNDGSEKRSVLKVMRKVVTDSASAYNVALAKATYRKWFKEGSPVKTAIRMAYVPGALKVSFKTDDDDHMTVTIAKDDKYRIDLPTMQATIGKEVFHDPKWFNKCEQLCRMTAMMFNNRIGGSDTFDYSVDAISRDFKFAHGDCDNGSDWFLQALQEVFDSILFIDDPDHPGVNLLRAANKDFEAMYQDMVTKSGMNSFKVCNTGMFTAYIAERMKRAIDDDDYVITVDAGFVMPKEDNE